MPYLFSFLPEGYVPILEAGSLLAFGDHDYVSHILEKRFVPEIGRDSLVPKECCPEIDRELDRLVSGHANGDIVIISRRRAVPEWHNQIEHPPIGQKYEAIPQDYFRFNDWSFSVLDPFSLIAKDSDPFGAEWFYPAVTLSDMERIRAERSTNGADPKQVPAAKARYGTDRQILKALEAYAATLPAGRKPNMDKAVEYITHLDRYPNAGVMRVRELHRRKWPRRRGRPKIDEK